MKKWQLVKGRLLQLEIEYHAVGDTWWQPLLSYGE